jgi:hypothetical protein
MMKNHPFERTLGPGPYKLVGFFALVLPNEANQGRANFHMAPKVERGIGTCAHCSHAIINCYIVQTSEGKRYGVGSDCILKVDMPHTERTKLKKLELAHKKNQRAEKQVKKGQQARAELADIIANQTQILQLKPHPKGRANSNLLNYAKFVLERSGNSGIMQALKLIKNITSKHTP